MKWRFFLFLWLAGLPAFSLAQQPVAFQPGGGLLPRGDAFLTTAGASFLVSQPLAQPASHHQSLLSIELQTTQSLPFQLFWHGQGENFAKERSILFTSRADKAIQTYWLHLNGGELFKGAVRFQLNVNAQGNVLFRPGAARLFAFTGQPGGVARKELAFSVVTSRLHYLPGEKVPYAVTLQAESYPDRSALKDLFLEVKNDEGKVVGGAHQTYSLPYEKDHKVLEGEIVFAEPLPWGKYTLHARSIDKKTGQPLEASHIFAVQGPDFPFLCETPFHYIREFCLVQGPQQVWHLFAAGGSLLGPAEPTVAGQERSFLHGTSKDFRHWQWHDPVLSISNQPYPDGKGLFENQNLLGPDLIQRGDTWYLFYTAVNAHQSESIALATSKDLTNWTKYEKNPVLTLEGIPWAQWGRNGPSPLRSPHILENNGSYTLYAAARLAGNKGRWAVIGSESKDLVNWGKPVVVLESPHGAPEAPQVWKKDGHYLMTAGGITAVSTATLTGWTIEPFPRTPLPAAEKLLRSSGGYADEVAPLPGGRDLLGCVTWRKGGNSLYLFEVEYDAKGRPAAYKSPFAITPPQPAATPKPENPGKERKEP